MQNPPMLTLPPPFSSETIYRISAPSKHLPTNRQEVSPVVSKQEFRQLAEEVVNNRQGSVWAATWSKCRQESTHRQIKYRQQQLVRHAGKGIWLMRYKSGTNRLQTRGRQVGWSNPGVLATGHQEAVTITFARIQEAVASMNREQSMVRPHCPVNRTLWSVSCSVSRRVSGSELISMGLSRGGVPDKVSLYTQHPLYVYQAMFNCLTEKSSLLFMKLRFSQKNE